MRRNARRDALRPRVVRLATRLARPFRPDAWARFAVAIYTFVRECVRYQHDPDRVERLESSEWILDNGVADCDGKVRLAVALARALGMEADVWPVWRGGILKHVQIGFRWPGSHTFPGARADGWVIGDPTIAGADLGADPRRVPLNPETGRLPLA